MRVKFYYKPANSYPERIYVLYGSWVQRNRKPLGIYKRIPFFTRLASPEEEEYIAQCTRMTYFQYENLQTLIDDEHRFQRVDQIQVFADALEKELRGWGSKELVTQLPALNLRAYDGIEPEVSPRLV